MASIFDNLWPSPDEYMGQNSAPQGWNGGYMDYRWGPEVDGGKPFNQFDISRRYNGMQGIDPRAMGESVLMANDPNMSSPQFAPQQPTPPNFPSPTMSPGATQFAGQGRAMGYAPEQPRQQQPLAQPPQQAPQQQYAQAPPSMGDRLSAAGQNLLMMTMPVLGMAMHGLKTGRAPGDQEEATRNAALQMVHSDPDLDPNVKRALLQSSELATQYADARLKRIGAGTADLVQYERWKKEGGKGNFEYFLKNVLQNEKFGLTPQYSMGKDEKGNDVVTMHQLSERGGVHTPTLPGGQKITKPLVKEDTGLAINWRNPFDGTIVKSEPKDPQEIARREKVGAGVAATQLKLPEIESTFDTMVGQINKVMNHKMLPWATGNLAGLLPDATPGFRDVRERIAQIGSQAWTQGIQKMAGFGALSNAEGSRIENATARLHTAKSTPEFKEALNELMQTLAQARNNARLIAAGQMKPYEGKDRYMPGGVKEDPAGIR